MKERGLVCWIGAVLAFVSSPGPLEAQTDSALSAAARTITADSVARYVSVLADDSMQGRDTPSRGLMLTANYLASQFERLGLTPGRRRSYAKSADRPWFTRYQVTGTSLDYAATTLVFRTRAKLPPLKGPTTIQDAITPNLVVDFGTAARFAEDTISASDPWGEGWELFASQASAVVAGPHTVASVRQAGLNNRIVFYVPPSGTDSIAQRQIVDLLRVANRVIVLADEDSITFATRRDAARHRSVFVLDDFMTELLGVHGWAAYVWPPAIAAFLRDAGLDLSQVRATPAPVVQELPVTSVVLVAKTMIDGVQADTATAVNVIGVLPGTDSALKQSYILVAAHMDADGVRLDEPGQIDRDADDNASGVAGLIALANAFTQPGARPRRSIAFVGLSGSRKGFLGARYGMRDWPPSSTGALQLAINLDMIGRGTGDSLYVDGPSDLDLSVRPSWIVALHPELRLTLVDGGSVMNAKSDHLIFVRCRALPSLYFYNGSHATVPGNDTPATLDVEQEARILRLIFYVTHGLAEADARPQWTVSGRQRLSQFMKSCP